MTKKSVLVGLSGGVDSAVSAYLLKEQGYEVIAGFMKNYADESNPNCHTREDRDEAIKVAQYLGIQDFVIFDFRKEYEERIINYIYEGYKQGITPNPDILCNNLVKFDLFLEKAITYGCDYVATGHYARVAPVTSNAVRSIGHIKENNSYTSRTLSSKGQTYQLLRGIDHNKDQSYFLSGLNQYQLSKALFPVGELTKPEVRAIAEKIGLPNAERKDSQGLCFIGDVPMKEFLKKKLPIQQGDIILDHDKKVGEHEGAWFFTIGQSRGLDINIKAYVTAIDVKNNIVHVSYERENKELLHSQAICHSWHRIGQKPTFPAQLQVKIRYRQDPPVSAILVQGGKSGEMQVKFAEDQRGIAPGQSIVAYDDEICLGGGIIA